MTDYSDTFNVRVGDVILPTWENVQVGDTVKLERDGGETVAKFEVLHLRAGGNCCAESRNRPYWKVDEWRVVSITRPESEVKLPTERGVYRSASSGIWFLDEHGGWYNPGGIGVCEEVAEFAPFTKLEPVPVTAKKIIDAVGAWAFGSCSGEPEEVDEMVSRLRKEFGVSS